ncbi:hypothetical protein BG006_010630 [Podila minutissima]|uniref:Uncharacterized protein n=1 Tax=Podila minutissima TaxID=64525 RepID=A0A9P5SCV5_9FUNG|nr:hypothetical protein BG006_010630 [Podila minutissima]
MFNWLNSPQLPDKTETQSFQAISGGPILNIEALNDRTNKMQLIPWEDLLEIFPNAIYVRDKDGIVMPARDRSHKRIIPRSIKLRPDEVLQVISSEDAPPKSTTSIFEPLSKIDATEKHPSSATSARGSTERGTANIRRSTESNTRTSTSSTRHANTTKDDDEWSDFQTNSSPIPPRSNPAGLSVESTLRQEIIHRFELFSAEQEERLQITLRTYQKPHAAT